MKDAEINIPLKCLGLILKPVLKYCLRHSLKIQDVIDVCKREFIAVAEEEIKSSGNKVSVSRLSVMTGIHRPDISQHLKTADTELVPDNLISRVIAHWQTDERFLTSNGKPKVLVFERGRESEFSKLVESISHALNPYSVLFELERIEAVERTPKGVRLRVREHIVRGDYEQSYKLLADNEDDLFRCVEQNVNESLSIPNLHLSTQFDNISVSQLAKIRHWLLEEGSAFHERIRKGLAKFDKDLNPKLADGSAGGRVVVCAFSRIEEPREESIEKITVHDSE